MDGGKAGWGEEKKRSGCRKKNPEGSGGKQARREEDEGMNAGKEESVE